MTTTRLKSLYPPFRSLVIGANGLISFEYRRFFEAMWERVYTLGEERHFEIKNGIVDTNFATTDVNTADNELTFTAHPYLTGMECTFTSSGTLPTGLSSSTRYWIIRIDDNTIKLATTKQNAVREISNVGFSSVGSGTHTITPRADIPGLIFNRKGVSAAIIDFLIQRVTTGGGAVEQIEMATVTVVYRPTSDNWALSFVSANLPDDTGVDFYVTEEGQVQYSSLVRGGTESISKLYYRARTLSGKNSEYSQVGYI